MQLQSAQQETTQTRVQRQRCTFVHAPDPIYSYTQNYGAHYLPLWTYTLASHISGSLNLELVLFDSRFDHIGDVAQAEVFLFSGINQDYASLIDHRKQLAQRFPDAKFVVGGPIAWSFDQAGDIDKLAAFDHIFVGDGEDKISELLGDLLAGRALDKVLRNDRRFVISGARALHRPLLRATLQRYYGAIVEVSRGCPFLCEFCDIRVLPDNNRPHNKSPELIVEELDFLRRQGVSEVMFACDNFLGDPRWAEAVVDRLLEWQEEVGFRPSLYTWLTLNLTKHPELMRKMRRAGFDLLFIGVESFESNALMETAKLQNTRRDLVMALRNIQSFGFIIVAGLIFGFDSDTSETFEQTLKGICDSGLLSGDPTLLTALPGTPLHRRMRLTGRLRGFKQNLGGVKYQTNIRYLLPREVFISGYQYFMRRYNHGTYQYARLQVFLEVITSSRNFVQLPSGGYGQLHRFLAMILSDRRSLAMMARRAWMFMARPSNLWFALRGLALILSARGIPGRFGYFQFWLFAWSNSILKYQNVRPEDFDIESVGPDFDISDIVPLDYLATADEPIPHHKKEAQVRATRSQLESIVTTRSAAPAGVAPELEVED